MSTSVTLRDSLRSPSVVYKPKEPCSGQSAITITQTPHTDRALPRSPLRSALRISQVSSSAIALIKTSHSVRALSSLPWHPVPGLSPKRSHYANSRLTAARNHLQKGSSKDKISTLWSTRWSYKNQIVSACHYDIILCHRLLRGPN